MDVSCSQRETDLRVGPRQQAGPRSDSLRAACRPEVPGQRFVPSLVRQQSSLGVGRDTQPFECARPQLQTPALPLCIAPGVGKRSSSSHVGGLLGGMWRAVVLKRVAFQVALLCPWPGSATVCSVSSG